ncbi:hypothetical protein BH23ACT10_BH23ACT10_09060 [soil metagenome]
MSTTDVVALPDTGPTDEPARRGPPRRLVLVTAAALAAFAVTRVAPIVLTLQPSLYGAAISNPAGDLARYAAWAGVIVGDGLVAYRDVDIEYPPGALPFVIAPALVGGAQFSSRVFVGLMVVVDLVGFTALLRLARRGGSPAGALLWLVLPPLLGVVLYGRLDLLPAVALLLALERLHARRWTVGGWWLGLGAAAKLVPGLFVPLALVAAGVRRWWVLAGAAAGGLVAMLPYAGEVGQIWHDVAGYHGTRGVHLESLWGSLLNVQRLVGGPVDLLFDRGAFGITGPAAATIVRWTTVVNVAIVLVAVVIAVVRWRARPEQARAELPLAVTSSLALLLASARVFSPQFVVWLLAAGSVLLAVTPAVIRWVAPALALIVVLTVLGYPFGFDLLRQGEWWPALVLVGRNLAVLTVGIALTVHWVRRSWPERAALSSR